MVGTAFLVFSGTLVYHLYTQLQNIAMFRSLCSSEAAMKWYRLWSQRKAQGLEGEVPEGNLETQNGFSVHIKEIDSELPTSAAPTVSIADFSTLREPVLTT